MEEFFSSKIFAISLVHIYETMLINDARKKKSMEKTEKWVENVI